MHLTKDTLKDKKDLKKEMASKMYSNHRCGKCNRFGHSHDKCTKDKDLLDKFLSENKESGRQTNYLS